MDLNKYDLYVFDVDGTLYFQPKLRKIMVCRLVKYYMTHLNRIYDLLIIKEFRDIREKAESANNLYEATAEKLKVSADRVEEVIKKWIYENPLDAVRESRDIELLDIIGKLQKAGKTVAIWSDYAADDKLSALGLDIEYVYTAEDERVGELKPSPKGLNLIMSDLSIPKDKVLMVGDREVKDGAAAIAAGVDSLILSKKPAERHLQLI